MVKEFVDDSVVAANNSATVKDDVESDFDSSVADGDVAVVAGGAKELVSRASQHTIGHDSPAGIAFILVSALNNAFILAYPFLIMSFLGWEAGSIGLVAMGALSFYCQRCLAGLHMHGGKRQIRLRELVTSVLGKWAFWPTAVLQWNNLIAGNIGLFILAGQCLQGVHSQYSDKNIELYIWIIISGVFFWLFAMLVPYYHNLRIVNIISVALIAVYASIVVGISAKDGHNDPLPKNYGLQGSPATKAFDAMGAVGSLAFTYSTMILPELQSTIRPPAIANMKKAIVIEFATAFWPIYAICFVCYWSYGSGVLPNVIGNLSGPKWAVTTALLCAYAQIAVSLHIYATPVYEFFDSWCGHVKEGPWSPHNFLVRLAARSSYMIFSTFIGCLLPFFGDFVAFTGAVSILPIDYCAVLAMHVIVNGKSMHKALKYLHYVGISIMIPVTIAASVSAIRYIVVDAVNYSAFANLSLYG